MPRDRTARRRAGQARRPRGGGSQAGPDTEPVDSREEVNPTTRFSIVEDPARMKALAAEFEKLDAEGRLKHLHNALRQPADRPATSIVTDRVEVVETRAGSPEKHWLLRHAERVLRDVPKSRAGLSEWLRAAYGNALARRLLKTAVGLAIVIIVGWGPAQRLMQTTSVEAIVNARLVTLRTPIEGQVTAARGRSAIGATVTPGTPLLRIVNPRADRTRLDELRRLIERLQHERPVLVAKLDNARAQHAEFASQTRLFQEGRIRQLESRIDEIRSEIAVAEARREEAADVLQRSEALAAKGFQTRASLDRARREKQITDQLIVGARQRVKTVEVELEAARNGTFVGDSYNDRPRSSQRADELQQQVTELAAELYQSDARAALLKAELVEENARFADLAEALVSAPSFGSIWEVLTAPGEQVNRGQELLRMLDCSTAVVTATVSESVYNRLQVGAPARFRFRDGGNELEGHIVHLTGVAEAPANLAIAPRSLIKEAYRVTVAIPELAEAPTCHLGRTGRVVFGDARQAPALAVASRP